MPSHSRVDSHAPRRRRLVLLGLGLVLVALALLAVPVLLAAQDARAARTDLTAALDALRTGNLPAARTAVARARREVDEAEDGVQGIGGDVWSSIPVLGTPVSDSQHLVSARIPDRAGRPQGRIRGSIAHPVNSAEWTDSW